jgi:hypothetical protein
MTGYPPAMQVLSMVLHHTRHFTADFRTSEYNLHLERNSTCCLNYYGSLACPPHANSTTCQSATPPRMVQVPTSWVCVCQKYQDNPAATMTKLNIWDQLETSCGGTGCIAVSCVWVECRYVQVLSTSSYMFGSLRLPRNPILPKVIIGWSGSGCIRLRAVALVEAVEAVRDG